MRSSSCAGDGSTNSPTSISSHCANFCLVQPPAKWGFRSGCAGYSGALAAWTGFTLPSAIVLVLFAYGAGALSGPAGTGLLHGLKLVAVAIVAQAVWGMARTMCPDRERASIAVVAALIILFSTSSIAQIGAILLGGVAGLWFCRGASPIAAGHINMPVSRTVGVTALAAFFILLGGLPILRSLEGSQGISLFEAFYRSGALVFGGGHVVLPLLREAFVTPGWVSDNTFLAGYGAAQAVPGPLFTFAAYIGAVVSPTPHGGGGAALGLLGIFLPGILILLGALPFWDTFRKRADAQAMMRGVNRSCSAWASPRQWREGLESLSWEQGPPRVTAPMSRPNSARVSPCRTSSSYQDLQQGSMLPRMRGS